jgi:RsiW-degrading membrane proteinase PrsW (M82 family)
VLSTLRWLAPAVLPALLAALLVRRSDRRREPLWLVSLTFGLGAALALVAFFVEAQAARWTGLSVRTNPAGDTGALVFLFLVVAPVREVGKFAACWPAFRSKHFDEPADGIVYSAASALGFVAVENAFVLHANTGFIWWLRIGLALPAHLFFAAIWGYALGRVKASKRPGAMVSSAWLAATVGHGFYTHFVWARGPNAMLLAVFLLPAMAFVVWYAMRDLRLRGDRPSRIEGSRLSRLSILQTITAPPSLSAVRDALRRADKPIMVHWILLGALVTIGAMLACLAGAVGVGRWLQIDFSVVDEHDLTPAPVLLLASGLLASFPLSGFLVARAAGVTTLLEPALAAGLALVITILALGIAAPGAVVFALAFLPVAWGMACAGAWVGRPAQ